MNWRRIWNSFTLAVRFLTIIPLGDAKEKEIDNRAFLFFFPTVGFLLGLVLYLLVKLCVYFVPSVVLGILIAVLYVILTRMIHLDGLIDTFDGLLGGKDKTHALKIMKEPQIGSFGLIAAVMFLIVFSVSLSYLIPMGAIASGGHGTLVVAPCVGRWAMLFVATTSKPARASGLGSWFLSLQSKENLLWASFLPLVLLVGIFKWFGLFVFALSFLAAWLIKKWSERKINGVTGDTLGAVLEITQLLVLLSACSYFFLANPFRF